MFTERRAVLASEATNDINATWRASREVCAWYEQRSERDFVRTERLLRVFNARVHLLLDLSREATAIPRRFARKRDAAFARVAEVKAAVERVRVTYEKHLRSCSRYRIARSSIGTFCAKSGGSHGWHDRDRECFGCSQERAAA
ncbi:MAG: hypothetical protein HOW73_43270 [Polyangiaceae bacterium]|nr:hypothetical protein [Polyangiaceae bacterium]